jgi:DNA repair photolyase
MRASYPVYCFARPTHTYLDLNAREDFEREIVVKVNVPELVRAELRRSSWRGDHVALGTNTDPYQWVERRYELTRGVWEAMRDYANPCSVLTKSPLLLRDVDLFRDLVARTDFAANLSIPTLDEKAWRASEPHTPHPRNRIEAVAELVQAGIPTGVLVAPLMPGINDSPKQVEEILRLVGEAGARSIGGIGLHLRGEVRGIVFDWLRQYRPDLVPRYEELYARGAYLPRAEQDRIAGLVRASGKQRRRTKSSRGRMISTGHEAARKRSARGGKRGDEESAERGSAEPLGKQTRLFG